MSALAVAKECRCSVVKMYDGNYHCMECYKPFIPKPLNIDSELVPLDSPGLKPALARIKQLESTIELQDSVVRKLNDQIKTLRQNKIAQICEQKKGL